MYIEVELALEVMRAELPEMSLVPDDEVGFPDFVEAGPAGKECVDSRGEVFEVLLEELSLQERGTGV